MSTLLSQGFFPDSSGTSGLYLEFESKGKLQVPKRYRDKTGKGDLIGGSEVKREKERFTRDVSQPSTSEVLEVTTHSEKNEWRRRRGKRYRGTTEVLFLVPNWTH